jgi:hypothetical protein
VLLRIVGAIHVGDGQFASIRRRLQKRELPVMLLKCLGRGSRRVPRYAGRPRVR